MAPKISNAEIATGPLSFNGKPVSDVDLRFFAALLANMKNSPDINWDETARVLGLKDAKCTRERWRQIRKKFGWDANLKDGNSSNGTPKSATPTATPKPTGGRKRTIADVSTSNSSPKTPTNSYKITKHTGRVGTVGGANDEEDVDLTDMNDPDIAVFAPLPSPIQATRKKADAPKKASGSTEFKTETEIDVDLVPEPLDDPGEV